MAHIVSYWHAPELRNHAEFCLSWLLQCSLNFLNVKGGNTCSFRHLFRAGPWGDEVGEFVHLLRAQSNVESAC